MKNVITVVLLLALAAISGCQSSSSRGGSVLKDEGFKIAVPTFATQIKQGEVQIVTVSLERGVHFMQDVKLKIESSNGINVEPDSVIIESSDTPDVQLTITAAKDAALGEYSVRVVGIPKTGKSTSTKFNVNVVAP